MHTDLTLDAALPTITYNADGRHGGEVEERAATSPPARQPAQYTVEAPSFSTPPLYGARASEFQRALSNLQIEPPSFRTAPPGDCTNDAPLPKSWYTIVGGPFEEVRFANYERGIRSEVQGHANCWLYGHEAGMTDEASASRLLR
eukprot:5574195-Pleurochrysis_carterae.AAC.1